MDESYKNSNTLSLYKDALTETMSYSTPQFVHRGLEKGGEVVLVIGGEVDGLSAQAYKLTYDTDGHKVNIPMADWCDSLNASVAASIVLCEIKRQLETMGQNVV